MGRRKLKEPEEAACTPKMEKTKKRVREDDGFSFLCSVCDDFGELICCERCRDSFHLSCLGLDECPDADPWLCPSCSDNKAECSITSSRTNLETILLKKTLALLYARDKVRTTPYGEATDGKVRCFKCKSFGSLETDLVKCSHRNCGKYYHKDCSSAWIRIPPKKMPSIVSPLVCPRHHCDTCRRFQKNAKLYRCLYCPTAYHETCSPEGTHLLEDIPGYCLCWKHDDEWKNEHKHAEPISDLKLSLERLPLPNIAHDFQLPRIIFDTVRRLQKNRPDYHPIRRNVYLIKRTKQSQRDKMECLCKPIAGSKTTCSKDCLCGVLYRTCSSSCGCGDLCTNLPFQKLPGCKLKAVKTERCGMGLIADEDIKAGSFLIEYVGEVIDDEICEKRLWAMKKEGEGNFYMCEINREIVIDATFKGNLSRYINHSCCPNCELQKWDSDGETRIGVFAISDIKRGDPVTYDYKFIQFGTDQNCYCGAPDCRGQLGKPFKKKQSSQEVVDTTLSGCSVPQTVKKSNLCGVFSLKHAPRLQRKKSISEESHGGAVTEAEQSRGAKLVGLRIKIWWPLDQKYYYGKVLSYDESSGKHQVSYDDGDIEALCLFKENWEVGDVAKYKRRIRTVDPLFTTNGASAKAVDSGSGSAAS